MKPAWAALLILGFACPTALADDVPQLKAIEAHYDTSKFASDDKLREKYLTELAVLRWQLVRDDNPGWHQVDAEIEKYPAPANSDSATLTKLRMGKWDSPRHSYLYKADGTWFMDPDDTDSPLSEHTHGTWSISGNKYTDKAVIEDPETYTIILLDTKTFIFVSSAHEIFFERRTGTKDLRLWRDE